MKYVVQMGLCLVLVGSVIEVAPAMADDRFQRLDSGEVLITRHKTKQGYDKVKALAIIDTPPAKLWPTFDRCGKYKATMLRIASSKEVWRKGTRVRCEIVIAMPFPIRNLRTVTDAVHTVKPGKLYKRKWELVEGDFKVNRGSWTLRPYKNGTKTLLTYLVVAEPTVPIPDFIRRAAQKKTLPELFEHIRKLAARGK